MKRMAALLAVAVGSVPVAGAGARLDRVRTRVREHDPGDRVRRRSRLRRRRHLQGPRRDPDGRHCRCGRCAATSARSSVEKDAAGRRHGGDLAEGGRRRAGRRHRLLQARHPAEGAEQAVHDATTSRRSRPAAPWTERCRRSTGRCCRRDPVVDGGADEPAPALRRASGATAGLEQVHGRGGGVGPLDAVRRRADRLEGNGGLQREPDHRGADRRRPQGVTALTLAGGERRDLGEVLMRAVFRAGRWLLLGLLCAAACSSDANRKPDGSGVGGRARGPVAGGAGGGLAACLDQPGALDRPPNGQLPCELIPPGLKL